MIGMLSGIALAGGGGWPDLSSTPRIGGGRDDAAVIVAVEDYAVVSDVPGAQANAVDWYTYFTDGRGIPASRVKLLIDNEGVRESMLDAASQARDAVRPGGTLWFVFVGHGAPGRDGQDGMLVGWDTQQTASSLYARGLSQGELLGALSGGAQAESVLVLDACFSGQGSGGGATLVSGLQPMIPTSDLPTGGATILSAGQSSEFAGPLPGLDRPAFSYLVLGALRGWGDADQDGTVSAQEAADYSAGALAALPIGRSQTPQLSAPDPALPLSTAREGGPDLAALRKSLLGAPPPASSAGSGDLASQLAQLQQLQDEEDARKQQLARLRAQVSAQVEEQSSAVRSEARAMWGQVSGLAEQGGEAGLLALQAFVEQYRAASIAVGDQRYPVSIPEVQRAMAWIETYGTAQDAAAQASDVGLRTDGYYRCEAPIYGGASTQVFSLVFSEALEGTMFFPLAEAGLERKYPTLRAKTDAGRGTFPVTLSADERLTFREPASGEGVVGQRTPTELSVSWTWLGVSKILGTKTLELTCPFVAP